MGRKVAGLEIGSGEIKIALVKNGKHPSVLYCELLPVPDLAGDIINDDESEITSAVLAVREAFAREGLRGIDSVALCLSDRQTVVRYMTLPALHKKEQLSAVEYELSQSFPGVGKTHSISFKEYSRTKNKVTGIASFSPKRGLEGCKKLLEKLDFKNSYIDVLANSEEKAVNGILNIPKNETILICDIGNTASHFTVISGRQVMHSRQVPENYMRAKEMVTANLGIKSSDYNAFSATPLSSLEIAKDALTDTISYAYSGIEEQLRQTIEFYNMDTKDTQPIGRVLLAGAGSIFPGLEGYISSNTGIPVSVVSPDNRVKAPDNRTFAACLSVIGAAIRED